MLPTTESILAFLKSPAYRPMRIRDLARSLKISHDTYRSFRRLVDEMVEKGELVELRQSRYAVPDAGSFVTGQLHGHQGGFGFVAVESDSPDIFIPNDAIGKALHGDTVLVRLLGRRRGLNPEGSIIKVIERASAPIIGEYRRTGRTGYVIPDDNRVSQQILVLPGGEFTPLPGQKVVIRVTEWASGQRQPSGPLLEILGYADDPSVDILALIRSLDLPAEFSGPVAEEANRIPDTIPEEWLEGRRDFRETRCITIDPINARDFDDAVSIERLTGARYRLGVHIADVSAYVPEGGLLDREALFRGTSVYLVDRVIPMLPHRLTNQICSLNPHVDRLTFSVIMEIGPDGEVQDFTLHSSVIRSARRLTYEEAQNWIETGTPENPDDRDIVEDLRVLKELSGRLLKRRLASGSLDFDLPEPFIRLDETGKPIEAGRAERMDSHRLIEECMLLANRTVAGWLLEAVGPGLYRIHEKPSGEKLTDLMTILANFGHSLTPADLAQPKQLQEFLASIQDKPEHRVINDLVIRSMKKARYSVENVGHYGLAFKWYTHFTSPIRRYPDLLVHRLLREYTAGTPTIERVDQLGRILDKAAESSSRREKLANEAERESVKIKQAEYMEGRIGEEYDGVISGIVPSGAFVELSETLIDGMVSVATLHDDYYVFDPDRRQLVGDRTRKILALGFPVRVRVVRADRRLRRIDFELVDTELPVEKSESKGQKSRRFQGGRTAPASGLGRSGAGRKPFLPGKKRSTTRGGRASGKRR